MVRQRSLTGFELRHPEAIDAGDLLQDGTIFDYLCPKHGGVDEEN